MLKQCFETHNPPGVLRSLMVTRSFDIRAGDVNCEV
jgi:hypothetical protein